MQPDMKSMTYTKTLDRATPKNTAGVGNPMLPGMKTKKYDTSCISAKDFHSQKPGSGDFL